MTSPTFLLAFGGTLLFFVLLWALFAQFLPRRQDNLLSAEDLDDLERRLSEYAETWNWPER